MVNNITMEIKIPVTEQSVEIQPEMVIEKKPLEPVINYVEKITVKDGILTKTETPDVIVPRVLFSLHIDEIRAELARFTAAYESASGWVKHWEQMMAIEQEKICLYDANKPAEEETIKEEIK